MALAGSCAGCILVDNPAFVHESEAVATTGATAGEPSSSGAVSLTQGPPTSSEGGTGDGSSTTAPSTDAAAYAEVVLGDGAIAYWPLDDTTPPAAYDASGNGYDGSYFGGVVLGEPGIFADASGFSARFDGTQGVDMGDVLDFPGMAAFSIELWFVPEPLDDTDRAVLTKQRYNEAAGHYEGIIIGHQIDEIFFRRDLGEQIHQPWTFVEGEFIHAVVTFDGITEILYLDGAQQMARVNEGALLDIDESFLIGNASHWARFIGRIDEVSVYDYPLSSAQVTAHFEAAR